MEKRKTFIGFLVWFFVLLTLGYTNISYDIIYFSTYVYFFMMVYEYIEIIHIQENGLE